MGMESSLTMAVFLLILSCFCWGPYSSLAARDTLTLDQPLRDGESLTSAGRVFTLGFFKSNTWEDRYLGLWYTYDSPRRIVWVANRNTPIHDSSGAFTLVGDPKGSSQLFIWWRGEAYWTSGVWQNGSFEFDPSFAYNDYYNFSFVETEEEKYFTYSVKNISSLSRLVMDSWGRIDHYISTNDKSSLDWYGSSTTGFRVHCDDALRTIGCVGKLPECRSPNREFISAYRIVPNSFDGQNNTDPSLSLGDCHAMCWKNCSCGGFASINENGTGCQFWSEELISQSFDVDYNYNLSRKIYIPEEGFYKRHNFTNNMDSPKNWWWM